MCVCDSAHVRLTESKIILAVSQKLQIQDYVIRRGSIGPKSVIDRLRHKVIKDTEEINDSLLGMEMSPIEAPDQGAASSSASSNDASAPGAESAAQADAIDFYSPNRLPVDVSFMEFDPQTPPNEILLQFQRLNLLYVRARSHCRLPPPPLLLPPHMSYLAATQLCPTKNSTAASSRARLL